MELAGAPTESLIEALLFRGRVRAIVGQYQEALEDYCRLLETADLPKNFQAYTYLYRGRQYEEMGNAAKALLDYSQCAQSGVLPFVHNGLRSIALLLLSEKEDR